MGRFSVDLANRRHEPVPWPAGVEVHPERWSWAAVGGPKEATIRLVGPHAALIGVLEWMRYSVVLRSERGTPLWWGYVEDASVEMGSYTLGMRIDRMYNRVSVAYTYLDKDGMDARDTTDWIQDQYNTFEYGHRELRYGRSNLSPSEAEDLAAALVARYKDPAPYISDGTGSRESATLICKGWWNVLNWKYYEWSIGWEGHTEGNAVQPLGVGGTSNDIVCDKETKRFYQLGTAEGFRPGDRFRVSGSSSNNGIKTVSSVVVREWVTITANTISFQATDNIRDSASGFDDLEEGDWILVTGSQFNNGMHHIHNIEDESDPVNGTDYDHIDTDPKDIVNEPAGNLVTIHRQGYVKIKTGVNNEGPGNNITITAFGQKIAQRFSVTNWQENWTALEVQIRINKVRSPTDAVKVSVCADSGGSPGTALAEATVDAADIPANPEWVSFELDNGVTMTGAGTWWIVIERTGPMDLDDFYEVGVDEDAGYPNGQMLLWDGTQWHSRPTNADLMFQVWGHEDNAVQLQRMLQFASGINGELFANVIKVDESGRINRSNRDGERLVYEEIMELLEQGTSDSTRYMAEVNHERYVSIWKKPPLDDMALRLRSDGVITDANGIPIEPGLNIAGKWLALEDKDLPVSVAAGFVVFVEEAEYDASTNRWRPRSENIPDPFDYAALVQG